MGIPVGEDMDGGVLDQILTDKARRVRRPPAVATHDTREFLMSRGRSGPAHPGEEERLRQLRSLGYIGDGGR